jgi:hypothetical protein
MSRPRPKTQYIQIGLDSAGVAFFRTTGSTEVTYLEVAQSDYTVDMLCGSEGT